MPMNGKARLVFVIAMSLAMGGVARASDQTLIISAEGAGPHMITVGFSDSSFGYSDKKTFCYYGDVLKVCELALASIKKINLAYTSGAHDGIELKECKVLSNKAEVQLSYRLFDDYGSNIDVSRKISNCYEE